MVNTAVIGYGYAGRAFHSYLVSLADGLNFTPLRHEMLNAERLHAKHIQTRKVIKQSTKLSQITLLISSC